MLVNLLTCEGARTRTQIGSRRAAPEQNFLCSEDDDDDDDGDVFAPELMKAFSSSSVLPGISAWITVNVLIGETRSSSLRCLIGFWVERAEPDQEQVYRQCSAAASAGRLKQILTPKTCFGSGSMGFSSWVLYLQIGLTCDRSLDPTVLQLLVVFFSLNVTVEDRMMMVMKNSGLKSG